MKNKKLILLLVFVSLLILNSIISVNAAASGREIKTVEYYLGTYAPGTETAIASAAVWNATLGTTIYLPESDIIVRSAWLEFNTVANTAADTTAIQIVFNNATYNPVTALYGDQSGVHYSLWALTNVTSAFANFSNPKNASATVKVTGPTTSGHSLKLYVTYEYNTDASTELVNTVKFPITSRVPILDSAAAYAVNYNATIAEATTSNVKSAFFEIAGFSDGIDGLDAKMQAKINADSYSSYTHYETGLLSSYDTRYLFNVNAGTGVNFSLNTNQTLTINNPDTGDMHAVGGELVVTYNYSSSKTTRTKTISYFMGQGTTRDLTTVNTFSKNIKLPENNVVVKNIWARVRGGHASATAGTLTINSSVNGNAGPSQAYALDSALVMGYQPIIYDMSSLAGSLTDGSKVNISYKYSVASNTPAGIDLFITYQYNSSFYASPDQIKTVKYFVNQTQSASVSPNFTTNTWILENQTTLQSKYIETTGASASVVIDPTITTTINSSSSVAVQTQSDEFQFVKTLNNDTNNILTATSNSYTLGMSAGAGTIGGNQIIILTYNYTALRIAHVANITQPAALETNISFGGSVNNQFTANCTVDVQYSQSNGVYLILEENSTGSWVEIPTASAASSTSPMKVSDADPGAYSCGSVDPAVDCSHSWTVSGNDIAPNVGLRCRSNSTEGVGDNSLDKRIPIINVKGGTFTFTEIYPTANVDEGLEETQTLNATVTCNDFFCGTVNLTWRTNDAGVAPNIDISNSTDITNYTTSSRKSSCGALGVNGTCNFGLPVNLTLDAGVDDTPANRQVHLNITPDEDEISSVSSTDRTITIHTGQLNTTFITPLGVETFVLQVANYADAIQVNITCLNYNCRNVQAVAYYDPAGGAEADTLIPTDESGKLQVLNPSANTWASPNTECSAINEGKSCILDWDLDAIVVQAGMPIEVQANSTYWNETKLNETANPDPKVDSVSQTLTTTMTKSPPATSDKTDSFIVSCNLKCTNYQCANGYVEIMHSEDNGSSFIDTPVSSTTSVFTVNVSNASLGVITAGTNKTASFNVTANRASSLGQIRCRGFDDTGGGGTGQDANSTAAESDVTVGSLSIIYRFPTSNMNISLHNTTTVNATVSCSGGYCGNVSSAYWRTNNSINSPNMSIAACSAATTDICFLAGETNPKTNCGILDSTGGTANCSFPLQVNFTMDVSGETIIAGGRLRQIEMNATAADPDVSDPAVSGFNFTVRTGTVSISLNKPVSNDIIVKGIQSNNFFNATITCNNFNCRNLNYSVRYADSGTEATTNAPTASDGNGGSRFFINLSADNTCGASLDVGKSCYAIWHATGDSAETAFPYNDRPVDVNVTSTHADTGSNASSSDPLIDILRLGFEGYITDNYNGLPLDSTQVTVFNMSNDAQIVQTTSNGSGYYFAEVGSSGTYYLTFKKLAYITETENNNSQGYAITNAPYQFNESMSVRGYTLEAATYASWYKLNKLVVVETFLSDSQGLAVTGATCYIKKIWNQSMAAIISNVNMTGLGDGVYVYQTTAQNLTGIEGTYFGTANCTKDAVKKDTIFSYNVWDVGGGGGGLSLIISSSVGAFYSPNNEVIIYLSTVNSTGTFVSSTVNVNISYPNATIFSSGLASQQVTGVFKYNFTIPSTAPTGTYQVRIDANYSGNEAHDIKTFIISPVLEDISDKVDYINTTIINTIIPYLQEINSTTHNSYDYLQNTIFPLVNLTNATVVNIKNETAVLLEKWGTYNANQLYNISNLTYNNTQQILTYIGNPSDNESANTLFGEHAYTQNRLSSIQGNLTEVKTIATQINITTKAINSTVSTILLEVDDLEELQQCTISPNSTICTLLNNIKTDTANILTLTTEINRTTSSLNLFSISALIAGSPRYANEEALVEATFTGQNGSYVTPDTINTTIYDKNDNIWATATKSDFTEGSDHIWHYSKSISSNPITGMYTVHMLASYNGVKASKSAQFRIATGGPYKVFLDCPSSSNVGSNLNCNVILQDEGEVATESTSTVWVDTNNNGVWDAGEPQTSFSKQTTPLQNVTQSVSVNVPSAHSTGLYVVRVDTSYANSAQPNSGASDSVTFTTVSSGGTGGGSSGGGSTITGQTIIRPEHLMDVLVNVFEDYRIISPSLNNKVYVTITFINLGTEEIKDALFTYCINNNNNNNNNLVGECVKETVAVQTKVQLVKKIILPNNIEEGIYSVHVLVNYMNETAESEDTFEVKREEKPTLSSREKFLNIKINKSYLIIGMIILLCIILLIITIVVILKKRNKHKKILGMEYKLKHLKELKYRGEISEKDYHTEREKLSQKVSNILKNKHLLLIVGTVGLISLFATMFKLKITRGVIGVGEDNLPNINGWAVLAILAVLSLIGIFFVLIYILKELKKIVKNTEKPMRILHEELDVQTNEKTKTNLNPSVLNSSLVNLSELINKGVVTNSGHYIGEVKEVILGKNKIDSLKIILDKYQGFNVKGIILKYGNVKSVGHVVVIDKTILDKINSLKA